MFGRKNSVSCTIPYGVMQETLFLPYFDNELYNLHTTNLTDTFHVIVDTVSCIMDYGFDILSDAFGHYNSIIGLKFQFLQNRKQIMSLFLLIFSNFATHAQSKRLQYI